MARPSSIADATPRNAVTLDRCEKGADPMQTMVGTVAFESTFGCRGG